MNKKPTCTAFIETHKLASGPLPDVAGKAKKVLDAIDTVDVVIFDDATSAPVDVDYRGTVDDVVRRHEPAEGLEKNAVPEAQRKARRQRGRPKLGVVAREVTLLPRHWDWLRSQPGGASVTLRELVDAAQRAGAEEQQRRKARDTAYNFISAMAEGAPGFENAAQALYAGDKQRFIESSASWPDDVRDHARELAEDAFTARPKANSSSI
jgi:hypothetical protein